MDIIIKVRNGWDDICKENGITIFVKVFGAVCMFVSTYALSQLFPFVGLIEGQLLLLIPLIIAISFFFNEALGIILFSVVILAGMSGCQAVVAMIAAFSCLFVCGNSKLICSIAVLVPICLMNISQSDNLLLSINLPFLIFFICLFFNGKIATNTWKYVFSIYYTACAYNFGLYGTLVEDYFSTVWPPEAYLDVDYEFITLFITYAGFDSDLVQFDLTSFIILVLVNLIISYAIYKIISLKNIKYLNLQLDVRDAIVIIVAIILVFIGMIVISMFYNPALEFSTGMIVLHGVMAYIITRPFASYKLCKILQQTKSIYEEEQVKQVLESHDYSKTIKEEFDSVIETCMLKNKFDTLLSADKIPINSILIYGKEELEKRFVVANALKNKGLNVTYHKCNELLNEYIDTSSINAIEHISDNEKLSIIVLEKIEELVSTNINNKDFRIGLINYFINTITKQRTNNNVLFVMTTDIPEKLPEELYERNCIDKICYGLQKDSILLNGTYRIICPVGKGGGGEVYKAHHERLNATVVVKKIINEFPDKSMYKTEADTLKKIKHMYLPKVYDVFEDNKDFYTVMDFIPGKSFQEVLATGEKLNAEDIILWTKQLVEAVYYLHNLENPIIHSDIKPGNIMLTPQGDICLIDFNISAVFNKENMSAIGTTPGYSPIEQYGNIEIYKNVLKQKGVKLFNSINKEGNNVDRKKNDETVFKESLCNISDTIIDNCADNDNFRTVLKKEYDENATVIDGKNDFSETYIETIDSSSKMNELVMCANSGLSMKSDIYSIGATIYHLITGEKPSLNFFDIKPIDTFDTKCPDEFIDIIEKCMEINPDKRYKDIKELKRALEML